MTKSIKENLLNDSITIASRRIKYLEINLTKEAKHLYLESHNNLLKVESPSWLSRNESD